MELSSKRELIKSTYVKRIGIVLLINDTITKNVVIAVYILNKNTNKEPRVKF